MRKAAVVILRFPIVPKHTFAPLMLVFPDFNPVALKIGPLSVRWYGLMYLVGFGIAYALGRVRIAKAATRVTVAALDDLLFFCVLGVVLGGRLGYVLFYKPGYYLSHPLEIFFVWQGGMSFHGGFLGVFAALAYVARKHRLGVLEMTDFFTPLAPLALAAGRLGNFINGELYGRVTDVPWGMVFPREAGPLPRHPSQLYQFGMEGVALFVILWLYSAKPRPMGAVSAAFLVGYGVFRFIAEYFREPDDFLGLLALNLSMGQWLSLPMIVAGLGLFAWAWHRRKKV